MRIENLRFGFACNSSSTHSIVFQPGHTKNDYLIDGDFGWEKFVAASEDAKKSYLKVLIRYRLSRGSYEDSETAALVAEHLFPEVPNGYIDHQAVPLIPRKYGTKEPCYDFFYDMMKYVLQDGVVIYGGNDNDSDGHPPESNLKWYRDLPKDCNDDGWVCRKEGDWWVLFSGSGTKITLSFEDEPKPREHALVPELVDLKITDFCPFGCPYCYQGSNHKGQHADNVYGWLYTLHGMKVFEVAIGGGEPTLHPDFKKILDHHLTDLAVNFSTRNLDWVCYNANLIRKGLGAFAFSIDGGYHETGDILKELKRAGLKGKFSFQYIMGTASDWDFEHLLELCGDKGIRLTLLGYKTTGRGQRARRNLPDTPIQNGNGWIELVKKGHCAVGIDTALAARTPERAFNEHLLHRVEGTHSMYIDAVTNQAAISSYQTENMSPITTQDIKTVFQNFQRTVK